MKGFLKFETPMMIAVGGLSGSGKTTLAEELGKRIRGAVVLDSDVVHKQLRKVDPTTPLPEKDYSPHKIKQFIRYIRREAQKHLQEGRTVIVTGTFLDLTVRQQQEKLALDNGAEFIGIYLHASASALFKRVAERKGSASDADQKVLRRQILNQQEKQRQLMAQQRTASTTPRPFRDLNWQIINADQPVEDMLKNAIQYIYLEHTKIKAKAAKPVPPKPKAKIPTP